MDTERRIFYKCNGEKEDCSKTNCYKNGGECRHTQDINYAESFYLTKSRNWREGKTSHAEGNSMTGE
ncbi:hypothetical protein [Parabacteroides goldsteinii]|uniref:hypothetical protein n=1 Tax=Parabacteroides goldsteinii TaxID=328812 RepID=UPI002578FA45|nr:hypothetical protein [Parabacteroides goldsteinii]